MRFWDSSALIPLLVAQQASGKVDRWFAEDAEMAVWILTPVELASAVQRLLREGVLTERDAAGAEARIEELMPSTHTVIELEQVIAHARRLLRSHPLRAADAMQLAAAWQWAAGQPVGRVLHTLDKRLGLAAQKEGFVVVPEPV